MKSKEQTRKETEQQRLRRIDDPEYRERYNRLRRENYHRRMRDPAFAERRRELAAEFRQRQKEKSP